MRNPHVAGRVALGAAFLTLLCLLCLGWKSALAATPLPQQIGVVDLLTQANVELDGAAAGDMAGTAVAAAGDVNGDGTGDVIVGAPGADSKGSPSGAAYVVFGSTDVDLGNLGNLGDGGFLIAGESLSWAGYSVSGAGDVNADGLADVIVAAPSEGDGDRLQAGAAYVVLARRRLRRSTSPTSTAPASASTVPPRATMWAPP
jgi:FG-GAP repeat